MDRGQGILRCMLEKAYIAMNKTFKVILVVAQKEKKRAIEKAPNFLEKT